MLFHLLLRHGGNPNEDSLKSNLTDPKHPKEQHEAMGSSLEIGQYSSLKQQLSIWVQHRF